MAIDPSIILQGKLPELISPFQAQREALTLRDIADQSRMRNMQMQKAQREEDEGMRLRDVFSKNVTMGDDGTPTFNRRGALAGAYGVNPMKALEFQQEWNKSDIDQRKSAREEKKANIEMLQKTNEIVGSTLAAVEAQPPQLRQQAYSQARAWALQNGIPNAGQMPEQYDPNLVKQLQMQALTVKDHLDQQWKGLNFEQATRGQDITLRGQNMTDARARENLASGNRQIVETPDGYVSVNKITGESAPVTGWSGGQVQGKEKALTEGQAKASLFGNRMQASNTILNNLEKAGVNTPSLIKTSVEGVPLIGGALGATANALVASKGQQKVEQAQRDFINATLRRESGAAIAETEFINSKKQYFPQVGDSKEVIAQKRANRELAIQGVLSEVPASRRGGGQAALSKVMSMADVQATAQDRGISVQQVINDAKEKGYTVR